MNARGLKALAMGGLAIAVGLAGIALRAGMQRAEIQGPGALLATAQGDEVWLQLGPALWRLSAADGRVLQRMPLQEIGLRDAPSHLVRHPSGAIVATARDDETLYFIDPAQHRVIKKLIPGWPPELARHAGRAIDLAFAPDGRIAIATGGGHAVALFDPEGRFLARTPPDFYRFTNGLWWSGDETLWTTDTNRFQLKRLDGRTLALRQAITLDSDDPARFLGSAKPALSDLGGSKTLAALIRLRNGMIEGRVVLVAPDGGERTLPLGDDPRGHAAFEPSDIEWIGRDIVASDGAGFRLLRWSAAGEPQRLADFGDGRLQAELQAMRDERVLLEERHGLGLGAALAVFAAAFAAAVIAQRRGSRDQRRGPPLALASHLTLPPWREQLALQWRAFGIFLLPLLMILPLQSRAVLLALQRQLGADRLWALAMVLALLFVIATLLLVRRMRRLAHDPAYERLFNQLALRKLRRAAADDGARLGLEDGETVEETCVLLGLGTLHWLVLTDRRLLVTKGTGLDDRLDVALPRERIVAAAHRPGGVLIAGGLELTLDDGSRLKGRVQSVTVARRMAERLNQRGGSSPSPAVAPAAALVPRGRAALASALVPGLGQWWQGRPRVALLLFVPWAMFTLGATVPVLWTVYGPRADVSTRTIMNVLAVQLGIALLAAFDAWVAEPRHPST
jgi:hypothetical protein